MDLQRPLVSTGQQIQCLSAPFLLKQQQLDLDHLARTSHFKRQTLKCTVSGRQDCLKQPTINLTEEDWASLSRKEHEGSSKRETSHDERRAAKEAERLSYRPRREPAWLKHDRQVLRFFAYFEEPFYGGATQYMRRRYCIINFHLEDGTLCVLEATTDNGRGYQGRVLKRHKMPRADGSGFVSLNDFKLGSDLELYKRVFRLLDCDEFTKWFCRDAGHDLGEPEPLPDDPIFKAGVLAHSGGFKPPQMMLDQIRASRELAKASMGQNCSNAGLEQYLENDRKVLVFFCYWDDKANYGCRTYYTLNYFLSDDSIEIRRSPIKNSGTDPWSTFLRREKLLKKMEVLEWSDCKHSRSSYYTPEDLIVGSEISVYGRPFYLYDCDAFTRQFYRDYMQLEQKKEVIEEEEPEKHHMDWPPHVLGIGTEEDTLESCIRIIPKRPHQNEREILFGEDFTLCFKAELKSAAPEDAGREFLITIRELNSKITVYEYRRRNSGHNGGKFLESDNLQNPATGKKFCAADFYVGAELMLNKYCFIITAADERTMKYMEKHSDRFPRASIRDICAKISDELRQLKAERGGLVTLDCLRANFCGTLSEHELLTMTRAGAAEGEQSHAAAHPDAQCGSSLRDTYINLDTVLGL